MDTYLEKTSDIFFNKAGLDEARTLSQVGEALKGADDGELFLEYSRAQSLVWDDGGLRSLADDTTQGFGLRAVSGVMSGYAHSGLLSHEALKRASDTVSSVCRGHQGKICLAPANATKAFYQPNDPLEALSFEEKIALLTQIDQYARAKSSHVKQVSVSLSGSFRAIRIMRRDGFQVADIRPLVRLGVSVIMERNGRMETGSFGLGGRGALETYISQSQWKMAVDDAFRQATVNLEAQPAPAGEMTVVLGAGWPGIMLHEAVGHGLEGDFNRKETSVFSGRIGEKVAASGVTVVDDGTLENRRGSLTIDDEGTPTNRTVLIEDGILKGYMQDRLNGRLMGGASTGNGRRESFASLPMPRMTNTYMLNGDKSPQEIIESVDNGIYAVNFGGGQVDITNGQFVFTCTEAYKIENGKVKAPVKGATLIGNGADALTRIKMIGNDMSLDSGIGTCGKDGQSVPVGVGQPTLRIDGLTVGGTAVS